MVKAPKTGRELTTQRGTKVPERVRNFFAFFGIRQPETPEDADDDSDA